MGKSAFAAVIISCMMSGAASAQDVIMSDPLKIDSMTRSCVFNSAFYSHGAVLCLGGDRGLQCSNGSWIGTQDLEACKDQAPTPTAPAR
jgi:hypothetical protein